MSSESSAPSQETHPTSNEDAPLGRLNIFAIPSRTTLLFGLIVLVIVLPLVASLGSGSPICAPFILFWMILLPFRDFFRRPDVLHQANSMTDLRQHFPGLSARWNDLATKIARIKPPRLMLFQNSGATSFTFGTFTRRFTALPEATATSLEQSLQSPQEVDRRRGEALLLHELAHFRHRDVWMAFFSHSLLRVTIIFMTLSLISYSLNPWLYNVLVSFFDFSRLMPSEIIQVMAISDPKMAEALLHPPQIEASVWLRYEVFVLSAHGPLMVGSIVLLVFFWTALLRTRELYADGRVAQWQRDEQPLWYQLLRQQTAQAIQPARGEGFKEKIKTWGDQLRGVNVLGLNAIRGWLSTHPSLKTRRECLDEPYKIYGSDLAIGATAGITVVLLNLTLGSLFLSRYIRGPNSQVPFIVGFTIISLSLLPYLCQFPERKREYSVKVSKVVLIFTVIKLIPQYLAGLVFAIAVISDPSLISQLAYVLVPGAGANPPPIDISLEFVLDVFVIRPALLFTFVMPIVLILFLQFDAWIKRRILRWYRAPMLVRHPAVMLWGITAVLAILLALIVLPILDVLTIPSAHDLFEPATLIGMLIGLTVCVGAVIFFLTGTRHYADRCPHCNNPVTGEYRLGMICPSCKELLHRQLCS